MKRITSILSGSIIRSARFADLPDSAEVGAPAASKKGSGKPSAKVTGAAKKAEEKQGKKEAAAKSKKADAKPAKKGGKKEAAEKTPTERKPRVEGRVDLVYRSGPERMIAIKLAEKHGFKPEKGIKVDNCTVGYEVKGAKAEQLKSDYLTRRDAWRKDQDALMEKHIGKLG